MAVPCGHNTNDDSMNSSSPTEDHPTVTQSVITMLTDNVLETSGTLGADDDLFALGFDSMGIMQLLLLIEEQYGVALPAADLALEKKCGSGKSA